ncbi:hypothetical protein BV898_17461 [Hypsibius exemplaris]|uniref:Uncharacterized protein n=1 Tax=Hypsibius exemplaris TaxID=2072580 RepID=A0A9X6NF48_HYPEX|nr:hypothetical protein BV898_17461 [Hypsibius exemplaris]
MPHMNASGVVASSLSPPLSGAFGVVLAAQYGSRVPDPHWAATEEMVVEIGSNLIRKNINKDAGSGTAPLSVNPRGSPKLRTSSLVAAIEKDLSGPNPLTRFALSFKYGVSATIIARVISQDLEGKVRKKCRVHAPSNKQAKQRLNRGPRFLRYINGRKWKNVITIDEAWVYLTDVNGKKGVRKVGPNSGRNLTPRASYL